MDAEQSQANTVGKSFPLNCDKDLVTIREFGKTLASKMGFAKKDQTLISTALSEICRNVIEYAGSGTVVVKSSTKRRIEITVSDSGPGIEDINKALEEGYSSGQGLGVGLPGAKCIMDEFEIESDAENGTTIKMCKWLDNHYQF